MEGTFEFDSSRWGEQVHTLNRKLGIEAGEGLREQSRLLLVQLIGLTPPRSLAEGTTRVRADVSKTVKGFSVEAFRSRRLEEIVAQRDYRGFERFMRYVDNTNLKGATAAPFSESLHQTLRDSRGRVLRKNIKRFVIGRDDVQKLREYVKRKISNVGLAKSGWLTALWSVGGSAAEWINRHVQRGQSDVVNLLNHPDEPSLTAINRAPWANNRAEGERIMRYAMQYRVNAMEGFLKRALTRAAATAGVDARVI